MSIYLFKIDRLGEGNKYEKVSKNTFRCHMHDFDHMSCAFHHFFIQGKEGSRPCTWYRELQIDVCAYWKYESGY